MVTKRKQHSSPRPVKQGCRARAPRPNKIRASTPYNFRGKNLTPYGGLLPVATLLEKLGFQALLEETLSVKRITRVMSLYQFVLALVLGLYVGFARLNQLRFIARDPILTGILQVTRLPPQSTLWRFLASLHLNVARQILSMQRQLRERAWAAANVRLTTVSAHSQGGSTTAFVCTGATCRALSSIASLQLVAMGHYILRRSAALSRCVMKRSRKPMRSSNISCLQPALTPSKSTRRSSRDRSPTGRRAGLRLSVIAVPGKGPVRAADAAAAGDCAAGIELRAGGGGCAELRGAAHRISCTGRKLLKTCRLRARFCPPGLRAAQTGRETAENTTC